MTKNNSTGTLPSASGGTSREHTGVADLNIHFKNIRASYKVTPVTKQAWAMIKDEKDQIFIYLAIPSPSAQQCLLSTLVDHYKTMAMNFQTIGCSTMPALLLK
jgi:hypothetical protein